MVWLRKNASAARSSALCGSNSSNNWLSLGSINLSWSFWSNLSRTLVTLKSSGEFGAASCTAIELRFLAGSWWIGFWMFLLFLQALVASVWGSTEDSKELHCRLRVCIEHHRTSSFYIGLSWSIIDCHRPGPSTRKGRKAAVKLLWTCWSLLAVNCQQVDWTGFFQKSMHHTSSYWVCN